MKKLLVLIVGGTMTFIWDTDAQKMGYSTNTTNVPNVLSQLINQVAKEEYNADEVEQKVLFFKDSGQMDDADRQTLLTAITEAANAGDDAPSAILVVHGGKTANNTAQYLLKELGTNFTVPVAIVSSNTPACVTDVMDSHDDTEAYLNIQATYAKLEDAAENTNDTTIFVCTTNAEVETLEPITA